MQFAPPFDEAPGLSVSRAGRSGLQRFVAGHHHGKGPRPWREHQEAADDPRLSLGDDQVWVGGESLTCIDGHVML